MKRILPVCALTLLSLFVTITLYAQAGVPNGNFESWPSGNNDNPEFWDSPNSLTGGFPFFVKTVEKTTDSHTGNFAAMITTRSILGETIPGVLSLGTLDIDIEDFENSELIGLPFTDRPGKLEGYFKYSTSSADFGLIAILLTKYNEVTNSKDSLAFGLKEFTPQGNNYEHFSLDLQYFSIQEPDSINILIISSASPMMQPGSQLKIDDLTLDYSDTPVVDIGDDITICMGQSHTFELDYVEGYTYTWINLETGTVVGQEHTFTVYDAGAFQAVVQNANGLPGFDTVEVFLHEMSGDANGDGIVNVLDIIAIVSYFTGIIPDPFCFENADVNQDGSIDVLDVIGTINIFAGK